MKRRQFLGTAFASGAGLFFGSQAMAAGSFKVTRTEKEWREMLTPFEYKVMREGDTEFPGSSPLDKIYDKGMYYCRGCDLAVYPSSTKYDSTTGWPSFWEACPKAIGTQPEWSIFGVDTEVHCIRCGSHFGHIFDDGPAPTGKRHCLNGVSLVFKAA